MRMKLAALAALAAALFGPAGIAHASKAGTVQRQYDEALKAFHAKAFQRALLLARPLADKGYVQAELMLAIMADDGLGQPKNAQLARLWVTRMVRTGDPAAELYAGLFDGEHGDRFDEGIWYLRAAAQGFMPAKQNLQKYFGLPISSDAAYAEALVAVNRVGRQGGAGGDAKDAGVAGQAMADGGGAANSLAETFLGAMSQEMTPEEEAQHLDDEDVASRVREREDAGDDDEAVQELREREGRADDAGQTEAPEPQMEEPSEPEPMAAPDDF